MSLLALLGLAAAGLFAGFVNTIAGGGSALTVPLLILTGLGADVANATNRVAVLAQCALAARDFDRRGLMDRGAIPRITAPTLAGAAIGAVLAARLPPEWLEPILLAAMVGVAAVMTFRRGGEPAAPPRIPRATGPVGMLALLAIGVYGGFVQAGVGLMMLAIFGALGYDLVRANALKAVVISLYTAVALAVFLSADLVRWAPALALTAGNLLGARAAVRFSVERGEGPIRIAVFVMVVVVCVAALLR